MRRAWALALGLACACDVYGPTLLLGDGGADSAPEACPAKCGAACVDLQTDQNNCGACGQTCETGCSGGLCTPTLLAGGLGAPHGLLVSGSELYVANHGSITVQSMSKSDGTGLKIFATSQLFPDRLAANATELFWTADANVSSDPGGSIDFEAFSQAFCNVQSQSTFCYLGRNLPSPYGIAVQGNTMFVTTLDATNNGPAGCAGKWTSSVLACPIDTGCAVMSCTGSGGPTVLASGQTQLAGIAADATNLYWADSGAHVVRFCPQPSCTGGPQTFAQIAGMPFDVVSDGKHVYFTDRTGGNLYTCPTTGCGNAPTVLASGLTDPLLVAADASAVYVTEYAGGAVARCDLPSCSGGAVTIATKLKAPYGIALDASYVYWAEEGTQGVASTDGSVSKLKR
jgi:hypothetical protein